MPEDYSIYFRIDLRKIEDLVNPPLFNFFGSFGAPRFIVNGEEWDIRSILKHIRRESSIRFRSGNEFYDTDSDFFFHILLYYLVIINNDKVIPHLDYYYKSLSINKQNRLKIFIENEAESIVKNVQQFRGSVYGKQELLEGWLEKREGIQTKVEENCPTEIFNLTDVEIEVVTCVLEKAGVIEGREGLGSFLKNNLESPVFMKSSQFVVVDLFSRMLFRGNRNTFHKKEVGKALDKKIHYLKKTIYVPIEFKALLRGFTDSSRIPGKLDSRLLIKEFPNIEYRVSKQFNKKR